MSPKPLPASPPAPAIEARIEVTVGAGESAFTVEAELALSAGVLVLIGPSGAGKSLTLKALAGLIKPKRGVIRVAGEALFDGERRLDVPPHRRQVGYVPQSPALFPFLDVASNVAFGLPRAERRRPGPRIAALLAELGLDRLASARPAALSGGERQRVAFARALAVEPRLLLLDEPFASIDREGRAALRASLREALARRGTPAVLVTHDRDDALELGDRVARFERGRTAEIGAPGEVLGCSAAVRLDGEIAGEAEPLGQGRARVRLAEATVEGPAEALALVQGTRLRLDLSSKPER